MKLFVTILLLLFSLTLGGCGGSGSDGESNLIDVGEELSTGGEGFTDAQRSFLYDLFLDEYLWYDQVTPGLDVSGYDDPNTMIDALKYDLLDHWSYAQTPEDYEDWVNQSASGFGCLLYSSGVVADVRYDAPCDTVGIRRGDAILSINGMDFTVERYRTAEAAEGETVTLSVDRNGTILNIPIVSEVYTYRVVNYQILERPDHTKVGHLIYNEFTGTSVENLDQAFNAFKIADIDALIVDMRYNGGGAISTASLLLDFIAGEGREESPQFTLEWNDKHDSNNELWKFMDFNNSLNINRVLFLSTNNTASASELVINALEPYIDTIVIGSATHGKPVGMSGRIYGDYIYWLINFSVYNADGDGDYFSGLPVDCAADDDLAHLRTDGNESMLAEALYYIDNDGCSP